MTLLLPIPRAVAFHSLADLLDRLRAMLAIFLTRPRSGPRHRLLTARQIRWQHWKIAVARHLDTGVRAGTPTYSGAYARGHGLPSRTPVWGELHPPPRTAHSPAAVARGADRRTDRRAPATAYALPNTGPGFEPGFGSGAVSHGLSTEPVVWPEASPEPWTEPWVEPWAESWEEPWTEQPETCFTGDIEDSARAEPAPAHSSTAHQPATAYFTAWSAPAHSSDWSADDWIAEAAAVYSTAYPAPAHAAPAHAAPAHAAPDHAVFAQSTDEPGVVGPAHARPDDEEECEFQVGDLARWWDEAAARLDAAAYEEVRNRLW